MQVGRRPGSVFSCERGTCQAQRGEGSSVGGLAGLEPRVQVRIAQWWLGRDRRASSGGACVCAGRNLGGTLKAGRHGKVLSGDQISILGSKVETSRPFRRLTVKRGKRTRRG